MQLKMHAVRFPPSTPMSPVTFGQGGGTIGRSSECTLALPDPRKFISRVHAQVRCRGDGFSLKVISKVNPVLVNNVPVGFNEAVELKDGDTIVLGDYEFLASLVADFAIPSTGNRAFDDPFASLGGAPSQRTRPEEDTQKDPFFRQPATPGVSDGLVAGLTPASAGSLNGLLSGSDGLNANDPLLGILSGNALPSGGGLTGPALSGPARSGLAGSEDSTIDRFLSQGGLDNLGQLSGGGRKQAAAKPGSLADHIDHVQDVNLPFQPPRSVRSAQPGTSAAPAGNSGMAGRPAPVVDEDIFAGLSGKPATASVPAGVATPPKPAGDDDIFAIFDRLDGAEPSTVADSSSREPLAPPQLQPVPAPADAPEAFASPPQPPPTIAPSRPGPSPSDLNLHPAAGRQLNVQDLIACFAAGVGMPNLVVDPDDAEAFLREAGKMLRQSIEGIYSLLILRAEVKKELRAEDRTMIASRENNPLKHTESVEEALAYLMQFKNQNPAFLPPVKAIQDAYNDVRAHELAVMAGMRAGLAGVIKRFEPRILESRIKKGGALDSVLPALYKSKLWDSFVGMYQEIERDAEDHFDKLFGREFVRAYMEQTKKLRK